MLIKKYSNRRLYDTEDSRYITLEELAEKVRRGADIRVVDAKTNEDLTQATLTQLIIESRGAGRMLPVRLLTQLIRLGDESLAEFLGQYMSTAMELYLQARQGAQAVSPYNPFAMLPFTGTHALARLVTAAPHWASPPAPAEPASAQHSTHEELADLRRELEEIKRSMPRKKR